MSDVLISIRPRFANLILDERKLVEIRRRASGIRAGDRLVIYSTTPEMRVVGTCRVLEVVFEEPRALCRHFGGAACLGRQEFLRYLDGAAHGAAIRIGSIERLGAPVPLASLRARIEGFTVPQSYRFLRTRETEVLGVGGRVASTGTPSIAS